MQYEGERWVRRLRDGVVPRSLPVVVGSSIAFAAGATAAVSEILHPSLIVDGSHERALLALVVTPLVLLVAGPLLAASSWQRSRQDRRTLARIRAAAVPTFFLPVVTGPWPRDPSLPTIWAIDDEGLHAWAPAGERAVREVPWSEVQDIDMITTTRQNMRLDFAIRLVVDGDEVVLRPRTTLGRPYEAGQTKLDILMRVVRSLRKRRST